MPPEPLAFREDGICVQGITVPGQVRKGLHIRRIDYKRKGHGLILVKIIPRVNFRLYVY